MVATVQKMQVFTASGMFNVPVGVEGVWVTQMGGGGSGGSSYQSGGGFGGGGGSSGELCVHFPVKVTPGGSVPVVIGAGGPVNNQYLEWSGLAGFPTSFGSFAVDGGATGRGGGPGGATDISALGVSEAVNHFGGSNRSAGGFNNGFTAPGSQLPGYTGATAPGIAGGVGGPPNAGYTGLLGSGGGGGASTLFGKGGTGGNGGGVGGSGHGPDGDTGGNPAITNGNAASGYGAGGGGAGGCPGGFSAKAVWGGPGFQGVCIVEWYEEVP